MKRTVYQCDGCDRQMDVPVPFPVRMGALDLCDRCAADPIVEKLLKLAVQVAENAADDPRSFVVRLQEAIRMGTIR